MTDQQLNNTDAEAIEYQAADIIPWDGWVFDDDGILIGLNRAQTMTLEEAKAAYE